MTGLICGSFEDAPCDHSAWAPPRRCILPSQPWPGLAPVDDLLDHTPHLCRTQVQFLLGTTNQMSKELYKSLSLSLSLSLERWSFKCTKSDATAKLCHALPSAVWSALEIIPRTCSVSGRPAGSGQNGLGIHVLQSRPCFSIHSICLPEHSFRLLLCYFSIPHHSCL